MDRPLPQKKPKQEAGGPPRQPEAKAAIRVVWSTDERFVKPTLVSILSLLEHASRDVAVHVMGHRLSGAALDLLRRVEDAYPGTTFEHIPFEQDMVYVDEWHTETWPPIIMARLLLPQFFDAGRVLHLDGDTLVLDDVAPLFDISMDGKLLAAARESRTMEFGMWRDADTDRLAKDTTDMMNGYPMTDYVNSGVILLDCGGIIRSGLDAMIVGLMGIGKMFPYPDQDILNIIFKGRVEIVGQEWNTHVVTYVDIKKRHQEWQWTCRRPACNPRILHFAGLGPKPWKLVERSYFEDPHLMAEFGRDTLLYRATANRLLAKVLGEDADVMAEFDFRPTQMSATEPQPGAPASQAARGFPPPSRIQCQEAGVASPRQPEAEAAIRAVWSTDQGFLKPTLVSILSLLEHASRDVVVHVMGHGLSGAALDLLRRVEDAYPGTTFEHIPFEQDMVYVDEWHTETWPPIIMARLLLPQFFDAGRVLHLDGDTLVLDDVAPLFDISMGGNPLAAARDARTMEFGMWRKADTDDIAIDTIKIMNGYPITDYVNSGVILLDCDAIISNGLDTMMAGLIGVGKKLPHPDQDILNIIFKGRVEIVGQEWNTHVVTYVDIKKRHQEWQWTCRRPACNPRILHFAGLGPKPWKLVERSYFEDPHLMAEFGRDTLLYRATANRLLAKVLGEDADVMAEIDFPSTHT